MECLRTKKVLSCISFLSARAEVGCDWNIYDVLMGWLPFSLGRSLRWKSLPFGKYSKEFTFVFGCVPRSHLVFSIWNFHSKLSIMYLKLKCVQDLSWYVNINGISVAVLYGRRVYRAVQELLGQSVNPVWEDPLAESKDTLPKRWERLRLGALHGDTMGRERDHGATSNRGTAKRHVTINW